MKRITISIPDAIFAKAQAAVVSGDQPNISAYISDAVARQPDWALAREALDQMISEIGGLSDAEIADAERRLGVSESHLVFA